MTTGSITLQCLADNGFRFDSRLVKTRINFSSQNA